MVELAEILRRFGARFRELFGAVLNLTQRRALRDIEFCRTPRLGGQLYRCERCRQERYSYHSCKNRHCPKCQNDTAARWLEQQQRLLLPARYFLLTATLPQELRPLARNRPRMIFGLLFTCAVAALFKLTRDRRFLGALPGVIAVLHTWRRDLHFHPHVHCLVTGGGLSRDGTRWRAANRSYLVNVQACSLIFRAKFRDALLKAGLFDQVDPRVWTKPWVVHLKPVGDGLPALKYLAPYIFRAAITNRRIERLEGDAVTFRYRDGKTGIWRRCTLPVLDFLRRFLQHVLPKGFVKVRAYGLLSPRKRHLLERARYLLTRRRRGDDSAVVTVNPDTPSRPACRCPSCGETMIMLRTLTPNERAPP